MIIKFDKSIPFKGSRPSQLDYILHLLEHTASDHHSHSRADIIDFMQHNHDDRYYLRDAHELKMWYSGSGNPNNQEGYDGDFYVDTYNSILYKKVLDHWEAQGSLKGETGPQGERGPQGVQGPQGSQGLKGEKR